MYKTELKKDTIKNSLIKIGKVNENCQKIAKKICIDSDANLNDKTLVGAFLNPAIIKLDKYYKRQNQFFWVCAGETAVKNGYIKNLPMKYDFPEIKNNGNYDYMYQSYKTSKLEFEKNKEADAND
jgi:hypothetical protein